MKRFTLFIFFVLIVLIVSGFNDYLSQKFDQEATLSGLILIFVSGIVVLTLMQGGKILFNAPVKLWLGVFFIYLILATISTLLYNDRENLDWGYRYYLPSLLIYLAGLLGFRYTLKRSGENVVLNLLRWSFLANTFTVVLSYFLELDIFVIKGDRASGINLNANGAGYIGVLALVFELFFYQRKNNRWHLLWLTLILLGIFVTFSKAAYAMALGILALFAYYSTGHGRKGRGIRQLLAAGVIMSLVGFVVSDNLPLTGIQQDRIQQFGALLSGKITTESTTNRSALALIGWQKIQASPLLGNGFREMSKMREGIGGVHNQYLLLWGEAGFIAMIAFVFLLIGYTRKATKLPQDYRFLFQAILFTIGFYSLTNHNMFSSKSLMLVLAFMAVLFNHFKYVRHIRPAGSRPQFKR